MFDSKYCKSWRCWIYSENRYTPARNIHLVCPTQIPKTHSLILLKSPPWFGVGHTSLARKANSLWTSWQSLWLRGACSNLLRLKGSTKLLLTSKALGLSLRVEISFNINWIKRGGFPSKICHFLGHGMRFVLSTIITRSNHWKTADDSSAWTPQDAEEDKNI